MVAALILGVPMAFVLKQPDLGTATLIGAAGFFVIFFAGLPWRVLLIGLSGFAATLPVIWTLLHDYQRRRVLTLLDPTQDPLGAGYHIIQSMIAIGSGGPFGKGWLSGTQTHLDFIPERTTDFIFAVYAEEFGLLGNGLLLVLYTLVMHMSGNLFCLMDSVWMYFPWSYTGLILLDQAIASVLGGLVLACLLGEDAPASEARPA